MASGCDLGFPSGRRGGFDGSEGKVFFENDRFGSSGAAPSRLMELSTIGAEVEEVVGGGLGSERTGCAGISELFS
jgi:hypothetical protein